MCPNCNAPVSASVRQYEAEKAKLLAEKEAAVKATEGQGNAASTAVLLAFLVICVGIILWATELLPVGCGVAVTLIGIVGLVVAWKKLGAWADISVGYDRRLKELDEKYQATPENYEKIVRAYVEDKEARALPKQSLKEPPKVADETYVVKCPTCGSPNCERVSTTSKVVSAAAFGLYSNKRSKQFKCNNCEYVW